MNRYHIYGLSVQSEIELPCAVELDDCAVDVEIRKGRLDTEASLVDEAEGLVRWMEDSFLYHWNTVGTFLVRKGREIIIDANSSADELLIGLPLVGPVISGLLYQRGFCVLHASSVCVDGEAVAFVGNKGFGKSTTGALLYERGHRLVTDDVLAMNVAEAPVRGVTVYPGLAKINLWPDSLDLLTHAASELFSLQPGGRKKALRATTNFRPNPVTLKHIYFLAFGEKTSIAPISAREAFVNILPCAFISRYMDDDQSIGPTLLSTYSAVVSNTRCFRLTRDPSRSKPDEIGRLIEQSVECDRESELVVT